MLLVSDLQNLALTQDHEDFLFLFLFFSHNSGGSKSKIEVLERLVSPEVSLLASQTATFWLCPRGML